MWNETKQHQLDDLRARESALTDDERRALERLLYELEQEEWRMLNPSLGRLRGEQAELQHNVGETEMQTAALAVIALRQDDLLKRAEAQLTALRSEHEALRMERKRVLNKSVA